ncbi:3-deoxy-7-phosphoheptulonate synthase [Sphaeroforma arctica JP610]|uniref:3-deoxy-7-phosphoheptulonate synthase n=1 Tax=Sphaeroforma arctica JP610 TaxID=667725 RepID=A0A0L0FNN3_9EUKA|nr:3-deoxy-7-phosphoheptulonate synthase [Sphaeroforma arctica JP610]KNC78440.1 3-deoxy-7-phosphoheptulonate synthase [Sphaeroforma arctica JP610]|eukprot:XP_014152342.1 3-deoxy-7-phosphoheptulonate synthase [Sphaeroforma arctica JP610]
MTSQTRKLSTEEGISVKHVKLTLNEADDVHIDRIDPLIPPQILMEEIPISNAALLTVKQARREIAAVLDNEDDRVVAIVGPCSVHDVKAALEYADWLSGMKEKYAKELVIIMRVYFEKPRTTVGWKGMINDPNLDGTFKINKGLRTARQLLQDLNEKGLPCAVEFLDTITPQFFGDLVAWGAIGARTTESQIHRELASGLSCPVGFKNGTEGNTLIATQAIGSATQPHNFLSVTKQGLAAIVRTTGNKNCHMILRGGTTGPNYSETHIASAVAELAKNKITTKLMIDCSHGNSLKIHTNQPTVAESVAVQLTAGNRDIFGVMIESNLVEGNQKIPAEGPSGLVYGKSITDACVSLDQTIPMLEALAEGVRGRRLL